MKIEFLQWWGGESAVYRRGDIADLPRKVALNLIERGAAQRMRAVAVETAVVNTPENAAAVTKPARRGGRVAAALKGFF